MSDAMRGAYFAVFLLTVVLSIEIQAISVVRTSQDEGKAELRQTVQRLRALKVSFGDTTVPPEAKPLLIHLKHQLRDLLSSTLSQSPIGTDAVHLQRKVLQKLAAAGISLRNRSDEDLGMYGTLYDIQVARVSGHPDVLAATTTLGVACGKDTSLYVYKADRGQWRLLLFQEALDYAEVNGAQENLSFRFSPSDSRGRWFLVTANLYPWCTSCWQSLRYRVLRPSASADHPLVIVSGSEYTNRCNVLPYRLKVGVRGFSLTFQGTGNDDDPATPRQRLLEYRVTGKNAHKISIIRPPDKRIQRTANRAVAGACR